MHCFFKVGVVALGFRKLTPADAKVDLEVIPLCKHSNDQQVVEVDAFHQQPVGVGHDTVLHHDHGDPTANCYLQNRNEFTSKKCLQLHHVLDICLIPKHSLPPGRRSTDVSNNLDFCSCDAPTIHITNV